MVCILERVYKWKSAT